MFALVKSDRSLTTASLPLPLVESFLWKIWRLGTLRKESATFLRKGWKTSQPRALALLQEESVSSLSCSRVENLRCQEPSTDLRNESSRHSLTEKCEILVAACPRGASKTNPSETFSRKGWKSRGPQLLVRPQKQTLSEHSCGRIGISRGQEASLRQASPGISLGKPGKCPARPRPQPRRQTRLRPHPDPRHRHHLQAPPPGSVLVTRTKTPSHCNVLLHVAHLCNPVFCNKVICGQTLFL